MLTNVSEQRFADICVMIHNISWTYFGGIEREVKSTFLSAKSGSHTYYISGPGESTPGTG